MATTGDDDATADRKLGGDGENDDALLAGHLEQLDLLLEDTFVCGSADNDGWCEDDAAGVTNDEDGTPVATVCVALFSVVDVSALVCLSSVWSLHNADMSGKSRFRLFSRNSLMSNTADGPPVEVETEVVVDASAVEARRGWTTAAGFWSPVTGGGGGGGRRRNIILGGMVGATDVAAKRSSCEYVLMGGGTGSG